MRRAGDDCLKSGTCDFGAGSQEVQADTVMCEVVEEGSHPRLAVYESVGVYDDGGKTLLQGASCFIPEGLDCQRCYEVLGSCLDGLGISFQSTCLRPFRSTCSALHASVLHDFK